MVTIKQVKLNKHYLEVLESIIKELEEGNLPWKKPWFSKIPTNYKTKRQYHGINVFNLNMVSRLNGYTSQFWITKRQAEELGFRIAPSEIERPHYVIMAKWVSKTWKDANGNENTTCWLMTRSHKVYNTEQVIGLNGHNSESDLQLFGNNDRAEHVVNRFSNPPLVNYHPDRAFYQPSIDRVGIPNQTQFITIEEYYSTLFHELVHSTGNSKRLNRGSFHSKCKFGDDEYAKEELVAELGAAFLCCYCGFFSQTKKNSAAYLSSWMKGLKKDHTLIFWAASNAQKAADYILGVEPHEVKGEPAQTEENINPIEWNKETDEQWYE